MQAQRLVSPERAYLIVGNPRSGTTYLASALAATGVLGLPYEYFWDLGRPERLDAIQRALGAKGAEDSEYVERINDVFRRGTTPNGVFGAKLFWPDAHQLAERRDLFSSGIARTSGSGPIWEIFGRDVRFVLIHRNCIRSAISLWKALESNEWHRIGSAPETTGTKLSTDVWSISALHADQHRGEIGWRSIVAAANRRVLEVSYDDLCVNLLDVVERISLFMGQDRPPLRVAPPLVRLANAETDAIEAEWNRATGGCEICNMSGLYL